MTLVTQAEYAAHRGVHKSTVSRWAKAGRLVLDGGQVDLERSDELLDATRGGRDDVAERHRIEKELREATGDLAADLRAALREAALEKTRNEARIKAAQADKLELERDQLAGELMRVEDVRYVVTDLGALLRAHLDGRAERIGAEVGLSEEQIAALSRSDEDLLRELAARIQQRLPAPEA